MGNVWKLEDAKARFSELVRRARSEGPQRVTVRGKDAVVVVSAEEMERLRGTAAPERHWVDELRAVAGGLADLELPPRNDLRWFRPLPSADEDAEAPPPQSPDEPRR